MALNLDAIGKVHHAGHSQYTWKDVSPVRAGSGSRRDELTYVYENCLKVIPSFRRRRRLQAVCQ